MPDWQKQEWDADIYVDGVRVPSHVVVTLHEDDVRGWSTYGGWSVYGSVYGVLREVRARKDVRLIEDGSDVFCYEGEDVKHALTKLQVSYLEELAVDEAYRAGADEAANARYALRKES